MPLRLLVTESNDFSPIALQILQSQFDVEMTDLSRRELIDRVSEFDVLWVRIRTRIDDDILNAAFRLKAIATNTTGLTHIDLEMAAQRGIPVVSLRGDTDFLKDIRSTAELTIGLALSLVRQIHTAHASVIDGNWNRYPFKGSDLSGKRVGVIGYGRLGSIAASMFHGFGCQVFVTDPLLNKNEADSPYPVLSFSDVLEISEIISLHVNLTESNSNLIGKNELARLRAGAFLINTSRGELIDEAALLESLESEHLAGAALDVIANEHNIDPRNHPLINYAKSHRNLLLTPHIGGFTIDSLHKTEDFLAQKLVSMNWF